MITPDQQPENSHPTVLAEPVNTARVLRQRAEAIQHEEADKLQAQSPEMIKLALHELQVHQIELEMQNEELRRAKDQLEDAQDRYIDLYDFAPVGYCTLGEQGLILQANLTMAALLGVPRGTLIKQPIGKFMFGQDSGTFHLMRQQLIKTGKPMACELRLVKADGNPHWVHLAATVAPDKGGNWLLRIVVADIAVLKDTQAQANAIIRDNTELQRMATEVLASKIQLQAMLTGIPVPFFIKDAQSRFLLMNQACEEQWGTRLADLLGTDASQLFPAEQMAGFLSADQKVFEGGCALDFEEGIWNASLQQNRIGHTFKKPIYDDAGKPLYLVCATIDITEQKMAQLALERSLREKEALLKEVHHRVKNNLQVITSLLRLESGRSDNPTVKSVMGDMQGRVRAMSMLHESLYRSGTLASIDLGSYIKNLATQVIRSLQTQGGSVALKFDVNTVEVGIDQATPCGLLVSELLSNCLKHAFPDGRDGEIRIELQPVEGDAMWCLRVSDTGIGIAADFEARSQDSLGLQLVGDLCKQLHSALEVVPTPGAKSGASFAVTFRVDKPAALAIAV
jgi:PAS domain S-box-containing protein